MSGNEGALGIEELQGTNPSPMMNFFIRTLPFVREKPLLIDDLSSPSLVFRVPDVFSSFPNPLLRLGVSVDPRGAYPGGGCERSCGLCCQQRP